MLALQQQFGDAIMASLSNPRKSSLEAGEEMSESLVIESEQLEHGGVQIVDMHFILSCGKSDFVGCANGFASFDAAAGHPGAKAIRIVVSSLFALHLRSASELAGGNNQGAFQQASLFEVADQTGNRNVGLARVFAMVSVALAVTGSVSLS